MLCRKEAESGKVDLYLVLVMREEEGVAEKIKEDAICELYNGGIGGC